MGLLFFPKNQKEDQKKSLELHKNLLSLKTKNHVFRVFWSRHPWLCFIAERFEPAAEEPDALPVPGTEQLREIIPNIPLFIIYSGLQDWDDDEPGKIYW